MSTNGFAKSLVAKIVFSLVASKFVRSIERGEFPGTCTKCIMDDKGPLMIPTGGGLLLLTSDCLSAP